MRVDRCVASVQEHKVPVEKEWGPQHRVRDSRSQVESSNFAIYQDGAMRSEAKGEIGKKKTKTAAHPYMKDIRTGPEFIKPLKENNTEPSRQGWPTDLFLGSFQIIFGVQGIKEV